ncbi:MAG: winged helix-turn-helix domain-containing protein [Actinobacteria bacterium]|nr:winged helix-turn-helix domain-containing protein [Actinomycetota bacterium]
MSATAALREPPIGSARRGLELLSHDLNRDILEELIQAGPLTRSALAARLHASATKLHECLQRLQDAEVVAACRRARAAEYSATVAGRELDETAASVPRWSRTHPGSPLTASVGWRAFADFGEFWRVGLVEWLVRGAPTDEGVLDGIGGFGAARLRGLLDAMSEAGMVARRKGPDGSDHHHLSAWGVRAVAILAGIARWEARNEPPGYTKIEVADAMVGLLASLSLVRLADEAEGIVTCTAHAADDGAEPRSGTVWARVHAGRVVATGEGVPPRPPSGWVSGTFDAWLSAALDGRRRGLRRSGSSAGGIELVDAVVEDMHRRLML